MKINTPLHNLIKLDTLTLITSTDFIQSMDTGSFRQSKIIKPNGLNILNHTLNTKPKGLKRLSVNETFGKVNLSVSSKILGQNYHKGICLKTLDQLRDEVAKYGLTLNRDFIYDSDLKYVDVKKDIETSNTNTSLYLSTLSSLVASKFVKATYDNGISFNEKIKTNPIRCTIYDKQVKMKKDKSFFKNINYTKSENGLLRFETRLPKVATIKKYFKSNKLIDVLYKSNFNSQVFEKIIDGQTKFKAMINTSEMTNAQEKNFAQIFYLNTLYNGNFQQIINHIKSKYRSKTKVTGLRAKIKKQLYKINNSKKDFKLQLLNEIREGLID